MELMIVMVEWMKKLAHVIFARRSDVNPGVQVHLLEEFVLVHKDTNLMSVSNDHALTLMNARILDIVTKRAKITGLVSLVAA